MFNPEHEADAPAVVRTMIETCYEADGMLWSSPMYNGSVAGSFKNAIDWLHMLGSREPAYLHDKVVGLISAAGGMQGLQIINTMDFSARSLRAWAVPYAVPVSGATRAFGDSGAIQDETIELQLRTLGAEVVRVAERFARDPVLHRLAECQRAADRVAEDRRVGDERAAAVPDEPAPTRACKGSDRTAWALVAPRCG